MKGCSNDYKSIYSLTEAPGFIKGVYQKNKTNKRELEELQGHFKKCSEQYE